MPHECFADEIAIDFPSVGHVVDRIRDAFLGEPADADVVSTELSLSREEAWRGLVLPLDVPIRGLCPCCGGRGETWAEHCAHCCGTGASVFHHAVRVAVPARVADGARFRFRVSSPHAASVLVEVRVAIRSAA
jgi:curved DNA-binding protein